MKMTKKIFVFSVIFAVVLVSAIFVIDHFRDEQDVIQTQDEITPYREFVPDEEEAQEPMISDEPAFEYVEEEPIVGDSQGPWHQSHFANIRAPQPLNADTPHGEISVRHIRHLNDHFYSRFPFSYQEKAAAVWLVEELLAIGHPWENIYVQEFSIYSLGLDPHNIDRWGQFRAIYHNYDYLRYTHTSQNVILTIPGQSQQVIVIGAHYDTILYPGASDNASGTALLLESTQRMMHIDNYYTLVYIFFGAEEVGLLGAEYYVDSLTPDELDNILFMVNADVLFEGEYFVFGGGYEVRHDARVRRENDITRQWEALANELNASAGLELVNYPDAIFLPSDQLEFLRADITVMMLFGAQFDYDGNYYFRVLHSYRDDYHYIMERWPEKIHDAMGTFSIFLEEVLLARY